MNRNVLKRLLSVMLCLVMVVSLLPVSVFAEDVEKDADTAYVTVVCIDGNFELQRFVIECKLGDTITIVPPEIEGELSYDVYYDLPVIRTVDKLQYEVTLVYGPSVTYKVYHYKETLNSGEYRLADTEECLGLICNMTKARPIAYPGFTAQPIQQEGWIEYDGSTVSSTYVNVYYTRNSYQMKYIVLGATEMAEQGTEVIGIPEDKNYKFREKVEIAAEPTADGYTFSGWETRGWDGYSTFQMPAGDVRVTGSFTKIMEDKSFSVEYYMNGDLAATESVSKNVWVKDSALPVDADDVNTVDYFGEGFELDKDATGEIPETIDADGVIKVYYFSETVEPEVPAEPAAPAPAEPAAPAAPVAAPVLPAAPVVDLPAIPDAPVAIDDEATPLAGGAAVTVDDPMEIEDEDTPLAGLHECCILHFVVLCIALAIMVVYMNDVKKRQQKVFEMREELGA